MGSYLSVAQPKHRDIENLRMANNNLIDKLRVIDNKIKDATNISDAELTDKEIKLLQLSLNDIVIETHDMHTYFNTIQRIDQRIDQKTDHKLEK